MVRERLMDPTLEKELKTHYENLNKDARRPWLFRMTSWSTLIGIFGTLFGFVQLEAKHREVQEKKYELSISNLKLIRKEEKVVEVKKELSIKEQQLTDVEKNIQQRQNALEGKEQKINNQTTQLDKLKEKLKKTELEIKDHDSVVNTLKVKIDLAIAKFESSKQQHQILLDESAKLSATKQKYINDIRKADKRLGYVFEYINDTELTEKAICNLISIKAVKVDRDAIFSWYSPNKITVFLSYPDFYRAQLINIIKSVQYDSDIILTGGLLPSPIAYDKNDNHWVWEYKGQTAPKYVTATISYMNANKIKNFSIKTQWNSDGKKMKTPCI
jgi:hypothetical protein